MELSKLFQRRVGAGSLPLLGSDVLPTGLPAIGSAADNLNIVARCIHPFVADNPVQRVAIFHHYAGAGPAVAVPVTAYCYVRETDSWYRLGAAVSCTTDVTTFVDSIAGVLPMAATQPMEAGDSTNSLEMCFLAALPVGAPDGTYTFGIAFDSSLDGSDTELGGAAMLAELQAIHDRQADRTQKAIVSGAAKGTMPAGDATVESLGTAGTALDIYNAAPGCVPGNYSTSRGDGSAVRLADATITFTGPAIVSSQLRRVIAFIDAATQPLIWEQGVTADLSISGTTITVLPKYGVAAPVPATTTLVVVDWVAQDKAFNSGLNAINVAPMYDPHSFRETDPTYFVAADQTVTNAWADLGPEILFDGNTDVRALLKYTKGDGDITTLQYRILIKHTNAGAEEFPEAIGRGDVAATPFAVVLDDAAYNVSPTNASGLRTLLHKVGNTAKYGQFQVKASTPGTTMLINKESAYTKGYAS